nr:endo-1,4-beta-xylanase [Hymenobacter cellulosilyticus]
MVRLRLLLLLLSGFVLGACRKTTVGQCDTAHRLYAQYSFPVGVAINPNELYPGSPYQELAIAQFNSVTPEFTFKPNVLHPAPADYDWAGADTLAAFCQTHNKRLHGHTLLWHQALPRWMEKFEGSQAQWEALFKDHIQTICRHFKGR